MYNYSFLKRHFPVRQLDLILKKGTNIYQENEGEDKYTVALVAAGDLEFEGSLSLFLKINNRPMARLSFNFTPGKIFSILDETVIFISCQQQFGGRIPLDKTIKHFNDVMPASILLKALEAIGTALKIKHFVCISAEQQVCYRIGIKDKLFRSIYDDFWKVNGGMMLNDNYLITCPMQQKDILLIKQTHRNRARKKRKQLEDLRLHCHQSVVNILADTHKL